MAFGRRYYRRLYRRYYRRKYGSYYKTRMTRNFKSSALNMTQGGTYNISVVKEKNINLQLTGNKAFGYELLNIPALITASDMHKNLSNVFDQYRVERVTIRIRPCGDNSPATLINPLVLFTCIDRSGFAGNITIDSIRTYGSYKETAVSGAKDISPVHTCYIGQSNLVEFSTYYDTKSMVSFPRVIWGAYDAYVTGATTIFASIEIDAQIRYRGVRLDQSAVATRV